jgi:hypothetical protein
MVQNRVLNYGDALPEMFVDQIQELISTYVSPNFRVVQLNPTTLQILAGTGNSQVCACVGGAWRYITTTISAADPGGAAASHALWLTATANSFTPGPPEVDATNYAFGMEIRASGTPSAALSRQIGSVEWNGSAITRVLLDAGTPPPDQTLGAATATSMQSRVAGDTTYRFVRQADGKIWWGPGGVAALDTNLYRGATAEVRTDSSFGVRGDVAGAARFIDLYEPVAAAGYYRAYVAGETNPRLRLGIRTDGSGGLEAGPGGLSQPDATLYRSAPDTWSMDDHLQVRGDVAGAARMVGSIAPNATTRMGYQSLIAGDTEARSELGVDTTGAGRVAFGPGGGAALDTSLTRTGPGALTLNGSLAATTLTASGAMTAPTKAVDTTTTDVATTAFVTNQASAVVPVQVDDTVGAIGTSKRFARADHRHQLAPGIYDTTGVASRLNPMRVHTFFDGLGVSLDSDYNGADMREDSASGWSPIAFLYCQAGMPYPRTAWAAIGGTVQWRWQVVFSVNVASAGAWTFLMRYIYIDTDGNAGALTAVPGLNGLSMGGVGLKSFDSGWQTAPAGDGLMLIATRHDRTGATIPGWSRSQVIIDVRNV